MQMALVSEKSVSTRPVLRFRDRNGLWLFLPNNNDTIVRLKILARSHAFEVAHDRKTVFVEQGQRPGTVPSNFLKRRRQGVRCIMHVLNDCDSCRQSRGCMGPRFTSPEVDDGNVVCDDALSGLRACLAPKSTVCPLYVPGQVDEVTIEDRHLLALGWRPLTSSRAFTEETDDDPDMIYRLRDVDLSSPLAIGAAIGDTAWFADVLSTGFRRNGGWRRDGGSLFCELFFDETQIELNLLRNRVRALHAGRCRQRLNAYRRQHCRQCMFSCERPPWDLEHPRPLTRERIMDENVPTDDDRQWMALFKACGHKGHFVNPETGRARQGIGNRPVRLSSGDWGISVCSLNVGAEHIQDLTLARYWNGVHGPVPDTHSLPRLNDQLDDEAVRHTFWALKAIDKFTSFNSAIFDIGFHMRNDVYYIDLDDRLRGYDPSGPRIIVGSDTRATTNGRGWGSRGSHIPMWDRPRFTTEYNHPHLADGIWSWFTETPGACCGRKK